MSEATDGFDLDEFFAEVKPTIALAKICPRFDLLERHADLETQLGIELAEDGKRNEPDRAPGVARQIQELEAEIEASRRTFRFQSIGRFAWTELRLQHPPTDADRRTGADFDAQTFPPAAIAASSLAPKISQEQAERLARELNESEFGTLWGAVLQANLGVVVDAPKSVLASAVLSLGNGNSSTTGSLTESPQASEQDDDGDQPLNTSETTTGE